MSSDFAHRAKMLLTEMRKRLSQLKILVDYIAKPEKRLDAAIVTVDFPEARIESAIFEYDEEHFEWVIHAYPKKPIPSELFELLREFKLFPGQAEFNLASEKGQVQFVLFSCLIPKDQWRDFLAFARARYIPRVRRLFANLANEDIQNKLMELKREYDQAKKSGDERKLELLRLRIESLLLE